MLVVVASPRARSTSIGVVAAGLGVELAVAAAVLGSSVQVVGRVGEDEAGEAVLLDLGLRRVGHVAVLRDAGRATREEPAPADEALDADTAPPGRAAEPPTLEAADLQLALSYVPEYRVIVVAETLDRDAIRVVADAAAWGGSALVVVGQPQDGGSLPDGATIFEPPADGDPDGAFAAMVGTYAAGLDRGEDPKAAFAAATAAVGSTAAE